MLQINEKLFFKEVVKTFFDLRIKVKYNIFRLKNLKIYMKKDRVKKILKELQDFNKDLSEYMEIYSERFQKTAVRRNLAVSRENNKELIKKYKKESQEIKNFEKNNDFPIGTYSLEINLFVEEFVEDILKLEKLKENQEKIIIEKI